MGGIPTIEIRKDTSSPTIPYDEYGDTISKIGDYFSDASPFYTDAYFVDVFDIYENGYPMADGRMWQCSAAGSLPLSICKNIPAVLPSVFSRINVPVVYERGESENLWTVFYIADAWNGSYVGLFRGRFRHPSSPSGFDVLPGYVPVFVEPSSIVDTWLEHGETMTEGIDIGPFDSGTWIWNLASCASSSPGPSSYNSVLPMPIKRWEINTPESYARLAMRTRQTYIFGPLVFGEPAHKIYAPNSSVYNISTPCYRRGDSHATFVWPGFYPF